MYNGIFINMMQRLVVFFILLNANAWAQQMLGPSYDISIPTGDTRSFIPATSILGFGLDGRQRYQDNMSFGVNFHWNAFKESGRSWTEGEDGMDIVLEERSMDMYPLLLSAHYYFGDPVDSFRLFLGGNIGVYFNISKYTRDGFRYVNKTWHFGLAPEAGFMIDFISDIWLMTTVRYNYGFATSSSAARSWISVIFGFVSVSLF